ncbi:hypothetical protein, partial [Acidovorax sp. SUPP2522]|uniref:hypothetical protein n=1 Tax=Acidovorax sp. SUPP2522 TaxID=511900 RepID=UPI0024E07B0E
FSAALYAFQFVVRYLLRCLFFVSVTQSVYGHQHRDLCNKAVAQHIISHPTQNRRSCFHTTSMGTNRFGSKTACQWEMSQSPKLA